MSRHVKSEFAVTVGLIVWIVLILTVVGGVILVDPVLRARVSQDLIRSFPFNIAISPHTWLWATAAAVVQLPVVLVITHLPSVRRARVARGENGGSPNRVTAFVRRYRSIAIMFSVVVVIGHLIWLISIFMRIEG